LTRRVRNVLRKGSDKTFRNYKGLSNRAPHKEGAEKGMEPFFSGTSKWKMAPVLPRLGDPRLTIHGSPLGGVEKGGGGIFLWGFPKKKATPPPFWPSQGGAHERLR